MGVEKGGKATGPQEAVQTWTLKSGAVQYVLRQSDKGLECTQFGPVSGAIRGETEGFHPELFGRVEGWTLAAGDLRPVSAKAAQADGKNELRLVLRHRVLPLEITVLYTAWGQTGVITRQITLRNTGQHLLHIDSFPSLAWVLPGGEYELTTLQGDPGFERQIVSEKIGAKPKVFDNGWGRSTRKMSAWFSLRQDKTGLHTLAQLAWSGNWKMSLRRPAVADRPTSAGQDLLVEMGARFDYDGALLLPAGESIALPAVAFTATTGELDDAALALRRYQNQYVIPRNPANEPPLVQFNTWYQFADKINAAELKRCIDEAAAIGCEVFVIDSGWYVKKDWWEEVGDWQVNREKFPQGTAEVAQYAHAKGMKFGIWVEIESAGKQTEVARLHPDWFFHREGSPIMTGPRYHLDFGKPQVRAWARGVMDRLIRENKLDWVKIDYNVDIGGEFSATDGTRPGDVHYKHIQGYYTWLDELRAAYPKLIVENCSSGGMRLDLGMIGHTHTSWISDQVNPKSSVQLAYGATMEFAPKICNHWILGEGEDWTVNSKIPWGYWDFMFRVPMNGQFGISSQILKWSPELKQCAAQNIALYKRIRPILAEGDCYHLTPPPDNKNPTGWMALQYAAPDRARSVIMVYRLGGSPPQLTLKLKGLDPKRTYRLEQDGVDKGALNGQVLASEGITVSLPEEWRACVLELGVPPDQ